MNTDHVTARPLSVAVSTKLAMRFIGGGPYTTTLEMDPGEGKTIIFLALAVWYARKNPLVSVAIMVHSDNCAVQMNDERTTALSYCDEASSVEVFCTLNMEEGRYLHHKIGLMIVDEADEALSRTAFFVDGLAHKIKGLFVGLETTSKLFVTGTADVKMIQ